MINVMYYNILKFPVSMDRLIALSAGNYSFRIEKERHNLTAYSSFFIRNIFPFCHITKLIY